MPYTLAGISDGRLGRVAKRSFGTLLSIFVALSSLAQTPTSGPRRFTLEEAIDYALANYPAVRAALSRTEAARAGISVARMSYLPQASSLYQVNRATANNIVGTLQPQGVIPSISGPVLPSTSNSGVWGSAAGLLLSWEPIDFGYRRALVDVA